MARWPGWSDDDTLLLALDDAPPAQSVEIDGRRFQPKDELHVTLVGRALGAELRRALGGRLEAATRPAFEALDWSHAYTGERRLIEASCTGDDGRRGPVASIIELVELPALPFFHRWLGELLGRQVAVPPPHVTLYTHGRARGIGLATPRLLRARTRRVLDAAEA
ncbi:hypothetical protein [Lysobacter humi (ex Lee et al. 2017)]